MKKRGTVDKRKVIYIASTLIVVGVAMLTFGLSGYINADVAGATIVEGETGLKMFSIIFGAVITGASVLTLFVLL